MNKCDNKCFGIKDTSYNLCISNTHLDFNADLGYVNGNMSYAPLTEKPQINYRILQSGNNSYEYLGLQEEINDITEQDIDNLIFGG